MFATFISDPFIIYGKRLWNEKIETWNIFPLQEGNLKEMMYSILKKRPNCATDTDLIAGLPMTLLRAQ